MDAGVLSERVVRHAIDLWNQGRLDEYIACYSADVEWDLNGVSGRGLRGIPEILGAQLTAFPDTRMEILRIVSRGDEVAMEATSSGTNTGPVRLGGADPRPPTGERVSRDVALFFGVRGGHIARFREYSNRPQLIEMV